MTVVRPSSAAAMAAVSTARRSGELTTASIGAPAPRRQAAALACRVPLALSGRSRCPLKRCSGDSRVSPCLSRMVVVGSAVGLSQPSVIDVTAPRSRCPGCAGSLSRRILGRGFAAEGIEELIAEGVHGLERSAGSRQQPILPVPGGDLLEYRRGAGDDRDRQ